MAEIKALEKHNRVGPILKTGEIADAAVEAIGEDNPGKKLNIEDHAAYVRISTDGECVIRRETMEKMIGRPFKMQELEVVLSSFAGQIEVTPDHMRFYYEKIL